MSDFLKLVKSEKDVVGALAYSLVRKKREAASAAFLKKHSRSPTDAEKRTLYLTISADLATIRKSAEVIVAGDRCKQSWGDWIWGVIGNFAATVVTIVLTLLLWAGFSLPGLKDFFKTTFGGG